MCADPLTQADYARHRGTSRQAVHLAINSGRIRARPDGLIDPDIADREWAANTDRSKQRGPAASRSRRGTPPGSGRVDGWQAAGHRDASGLQGEAEPTWAEARRRREAALARMAEQEADRRAGRLLDADAVEKASFAVARRARDMLRSLPDRIAAVVGGLSPAECHRLLAEEVNRICVELSQPLPVE